MVITKSLMSEEIEILKERLIEVAKKKQTKDKAIASISRAKKEFEKSKTLNEAITKFKNALIFAKQKEDPTRVLYDPVAYAADVIRLHNLEEGKDTEFLKNKKTIDAIETAKFITRAVTAKKEDEINEQDYVDTLFDEDEDLNDRIKDIESQLRKLFMSFQGMSSGGGLDPKKINSDLIPSANSTYDLGSADRVWKDVYLSGSTLHVGNTSMNSQELAVVDGITAGQVANSKAVIVDSNKDISGFRNVNVATISIGGNQITASPDELNLLDGVTGLVQADFTKLAAIDASAVQLNLLSDTSSANSTTFLAGDGTFKEVASGGGSQHVIQKNDLEDGSDATTSLAAKTNLLFDSNTFRVSNDAGTDSTQVRLQNEFTGVTNGTALANKVLILGGSRAIDNIGAMTAVSSYSGGAVTSSGIVTGTKINATSSGAESIQTAGGITMSGAIAGLTGSLTGLTNVTGSGTLQGNKLISTGSSATSIETSGGITMSGIITGATTISGTTINATNIDVQDTSGEAVAILHRNETGSNGNDVGKLKFKGQNSADEEINFAQIGGIQKTVTDGSEDGQLDFNVMNGGTLNTSVTIDEDGLIIKGSRTLTFGSTTIAASANELNMLDADTTASTPTLVDADQIIINDGPGTMKQVALSRLKTYMAVPTQASLSVDHLITLSGVSESSDHLGTFTGSTITNSSTVKTALQELETAVETKVGTSDTATLTNKTLTSPKLNEDVAISSTATELNLLDGSTAGTVVASKAIVANSTLGVSFGTGDIAANDLTLSGNLVVQGDTTTVETTTIIAQDKNITLANVATPTDVTADGGGLTLLGATNKTFNWVDSTDSWTSSEHLDLASGKSFKINGTTVLNATTLQYLDASSSIQTQLNAKQATISSSARLDASLLHDGSISNTEFGYLNGVSSALQTQIDAKASTGKAIAMAIVFGG